MDELEEKFMQLKNNLPLLGIELKNLLLVSTRCRKK